MRWSVLGCLVIAACANPARPAIALYEKGDYAGAARAADSGLAAHPADESLWQMKVRAALALGDAPAIAKAYAAYRGELGDDDKALASELAIATLDQALASPSAALKLAAIAAVVAAEVEPLAAQVAGRMADDDDRVVAAAAIAVLHGDPRAPGQAGERLSPENPEARRIAVDGIGKKVGVLAFADLEKAATDADPRVRRTAMSWLGQLKDKDAVEILTVGLHDGDDAVRAAAGTALARIGLGNLVELGVRALGDPALAVRLAGIELLAASHGLGRAALTTAASDPDPVVAAEAGIAVGGGELASKAIARAASATEWPVRAGAANLAMRALGKPEAIELVRRLAGDPEPAVRLAAARALAHDGVPADRAAAAEIFAAVVSPNAAANAAASTAPNAAPNAAASAAGPSLAIAAAGDLAAQDDARGIAALDAAVRDGALAPGLRAQAADAHVLAHHITPGLVAALADDSGTVRVAAAAALAMLARH